jgi:hypothetical protein
VSAAGSAGVQRAWLCCIATRKAVAGCTCSDVMLHVVVQVWMLDVLLTVWSCCVFCWYTLVWSGSISSLHGGRCNMLTAWQQCMHKRSTVARDRLFVSALQAQSLLLLLALLLCAAWQHQ